MGGHENCPLVASTTVAEKLEVWLRSWFMFAVGFGELWIAVVLSLRRAILPRTLGSPLAHFSSKWR